MSFFANFVNSKRTQKILAIFRVENVQFFDVGISWHRQNVLCKEEEREEHEQSSVLIVCFILDVS